MKAGGRGARNLRVRVKTARGRKASSTRWLARQLNDPFVQEAQRLGFRSRAAFKLIQLDDKFRILKKGQRVVDLGAAPGGWTQVAVARTGAAEGGGAVVAVDIEKMEPVAGARILQKDIREASKALRGALGGPADVVLSDMAAPTIGHRATDHLRTMALCEEALAFARDYLAPGGAFVVKAFAGGAHADLMRAINLAFEDARTLKPPASRPESPETYIVAKGYRGTKTG